MAESTREELEEAADEIRDETAKAGNTPARVGGFCRNLVDSVVLASEGVELSGDAGGDLTGSYPDPTVSAGAITLAKMADITTDRLIGRDTTDAGQPEEIEVTGGLEFTGGGGVRRSALTGDVTASAGSNATTIATNAVTFAKMQAVVTDRLLGRDTTGTGNVEALTVGGGLEFTGSGGIQRSALTGDVTASAGSNTTEIADEAVTFAKMQPISTDTLLGRDSLSSGDVEEIGVGGGIEFSGSKAIQRSALTGDVTASAGSNSTTIANDAVTNAKLANMAAGTVKGRAAGAGTGDPTDRTDASVVDGGLGLTRLGPTKVGNTPTVIGSIPLTTVTAGLSGDGTAIVEFDVYAAAIVSGFGTYSFYQRAVFAVHYQTDPSYTLTTLDVELVYSSSYFDDGSSNGRLVEITVDQDSGNLRLLGDGYFNLGSGDADGVTVYAVAKVTPVQPALPT